jgi:Fe-S cluster assembly ATPase SufC
VIGRVKDGIFVTFNQPMEFNAVRHVSISETTNLHESNTDIVVFRMYSPTRRLQDKSGRALNDRVITSYA